MRACCVFGLLVAVGCGRQLNPEYCLHNPMDGDCQDAGLVFIDAPAPCTGNGVCTEPGKPVCDVGLGICVECTMTSSAACTGATGVCSTDDVCVGCFQNSQCPSQICLGDTNTCAAPGDVLFAAPTATGNGSCLTDINACTLTTAIGKARTAAMTPGAMPVISMAAGDYHQAPITLDAAHIQIVAAVGQIVTITATTDGSVFNVTAGVAVLQNVTVYGAKNADAIVCNNATLTLDTVIIRDNEKSGLHARNCTVTIDRGTYSGNTDHAMDIDATKLVARNNVILNNGNNEIDDGAVKLGPATTGEFRFSTVAFNDGKNGGGPGNQPTAGLYCNIANFPPKIFNATDNLFADNKGQQIWTNQAHECDTGRSWQGSAMTVVFKNSVTQPYDLHLTATTPTTGQNDIRDNPNSNCGNVPHDFDGLLRPINVTCDVGAYEFRP